MQQHSTASFLQGVLCPYILPSDDVASSRVRENRSVGEAGVRRAHDQPVPVVEGSDDTAPGSVNASLAVNLRDCHPPALYTDAVERSATGRQLDVLHARLVVLDVLTLIILDGARRFHRDEDEHLLAIVFHGNPLEPT
jgi:hypothetical protein